MMLLFFLSWDGPVQYLCDSGAVTVRSLAGRSGIQLALTKL